MDLAELQVLSDVEIYIKNGEIKIKERPWREYKRYNMVLSNVYSIINPSKAARLANCASNLVFVVDKSDRKKLKLANFCRVRLCPTCNWRRGLKVFAQLSKIIKAMPDNYRYLMLTLTVPNIYGDKLSDTIDEMTIAVNKLTKFKQFDGIVDGWFRAMEITHDIYPTITPTLWEHSKKYYQKVGLKMWDKNPNYDKYHPHYHMILAVKPSYFSGSNYMSRLEWAGLWGRALGVDDYRQVDIRPIKGDVLSGVAEVAKYAVKATDYLDENDADMTINTVTLLDSVLSHRRFVGLGGEFRRLHKLLNLTKMDDDQNLVNLDEDAQVDDVGAYELSYIWHVGYSEYCLAD
jgi:plasmid rolling circle replication initiator protein Rep